jgi:hypothetical protein
MLRTKPTVEDMPHLLTVAPLAGMVLSCSQPWQPSTINNKKDIDIEQLSYWSLSEENVEKSAATVCTGCAHTSLARNDNCHKPYDTYNYRNYAFALSTTIEREYDSVDPCFKWGI